MRSVDYGDFRVSVLHLPEDARHWNLVYDFLKVRRDIFVQKMKWQLMDNNGIEFEQYDIVGLANYVIAHTGTSVIAGARLIRCDKVVGQYSYMIRDSYFGKIDLPSDICDVEPPNDTKSWELTRLVSNASDTLVAKAVLDVANDFIFEENGVRCLFLGPPGFLRMARTYGYNTKKMGKITGDSSGKFLAFECEIRNRPERSFDTI